MAGDRMATAPKILVIRRRYLGDVVLLGSLLRNLKLHWPAAAIWVAAEPAYAGILGLNPDVTVVLPPPRGPVSWAGFVRRLRRERFTHIFDLDNTERTALAARLSGAPFRLALHHGSHPLRLAGLYTHRVHDPSAVHEVQPITNYYLQALGPAGVPVLTREVRLVPRPDDVATWRRFVGAAGKVLLVHPGSRSAARIWPAEQFAAVCDRVQDELGAQVVLVGGPAEADLVARIRARARVHLLSPPEPLSQPHFAALAAACNALLCHDSGPMHVAAAVGTPVIALYGSQNPLLFPPVGTGHRLLIPSMPCRDCVAPDQCVPGDSYRTYCVRRHSVDEVLAAVRATLAVTPAQA